MTEDPAALIAAIRADHTEFDSDPEGIPYSRPVCGLCVQDWPCEAARAADMIERVLAHNGECGECDGWHFCCEQVDSEKARADQSEHSMHLMADRLRAEIARADRLSRDYDQARRELTVRAQRAEAERCPEDHRFLLAAIDRAEAELQSKLALIAGAVRDGKQYTSAAHCMNVIRSLIARDNSST